MAAIYWLVGAINLPIIHYSVLWWRTLHQGQSISISGSTIDGSLLWPLPLTMIGFTCLFGAAVLMRIRAELAETKVEARMRRPGDPARRDGRKGVDRATRRRRHYSLYCHRREIADSGQLSRDRPRPV